MFSHDENSAGYSACDIKYGESSCLDYCYGTPSPYDVPWMGKSSSITSVNIENKIKPKRMNYWFQNLRNISSLNVSNIDVSECEDFKGTFEGCNNIETLDLSSWNTKSAKTMEIMFENCLKLTNISYGENFTQPSTIKEMFSFPSQSGMAAGSFCPANRPEWYTLDKKGSVAENVVSNVGEMRVNTDGFSNIEILQIVPQSWQEFSIDCYNSSNNKIQTLKTNYAPGINTMNYSGSTEKRYCCTFPSGTSYIIIKIRSTWTQAISEVKYSANYILY